MLVVDRVELIALHQAYQVGKLHRDHAGRLQRDLHTGDEVVQIRHVGQHVVADQEIRLIRGPLFVGEDYETEREVIALSGSRRTESLWVRTTVFADDDVPVAKMLLNLASIKDSYAPYAEEHGRLYA